MSGEDVFPREILGHGAYGCLRFSAGADRQAVAAVPLAALAERLGLRNEFEPGTPRPAASIAFLRRAGATPGDIPDDGVLHADGVIHTAAPSPEPLEEFWAEAGRLLGSAATVRLLRGVVRPKIYTSVTMQNFAYTHAVVQQPGPAMPNAFLFPLCKTAEWWPKGWMERHTYFLPRYDGEGRMVSQGHALAAAAAVPCILRRTYKHLTEPAPAGTYDFVTYFECADADVPTFHAVCASLRDVEKNPEWKFVREGPLWHGRRVGTWPELVAA